MGGRRARATRVGQDVRGAPAPAWARAGDHDVLGGDSAQGADEATRLGIELPALAPETSERLRSLLPAAATVGNPIDYTAMIWGEVETLAELVAVVGGDPAIDQVLVFYDQPPGIEGPPEESWRAVREGITAGAARSPVPTIVASTLPELLDDAAAWRFIGSGIPAVAGLRTGLVCAAGWMTPPGDPERLRAIGRAARVAAGAGASAGTGAGAGASAAAGRRACGCLSMIPRRCSARPACRS